MMHLFQTIYERIRPKSRSEVFADTLAEICKKSELEATIVYSKHLAVVLDDEKKIVDIVVS